MIEEGLIKNQKPLQALKIAICGGEEDRILTLLTTVCSGPLKSLCLHMPICVSKWVSAMQLSNNNTTSALKVFSPTYCPFTPLKYSRRIAGLKILIPNTTPPCSLATLMKNINV